MTAFACCTDIVLSFYGITQHKKVMKLYCVSMDRIRMLFLSVRLSFYRGMLDGVELGRDAS